MFIASRDGKFYAWKLPNRWRPIWVDQLERDLLFANKHKEYLQAEGAEEAK
jgi:hypothetical protein